MAKDTCVICGQETAYDFETHIDLRNGYLEGLGQLCTSCFRKRNQDSEETICIPKELINDTPNDMELGKKVRTMYNGLK